LRGTQALGLAIDYLPKFAAYCFGLFEEQLLRGPAHFREQAEAKIAEFFNEEVAAALCGMNNNK
jgi:hypothetical protein